VTCSSICQLQSGRLHARPEMFCVVPSISDVSLTMRHVGDADDVVVYDGPPCAGCDVTGFVHAAQLQSTIPSPVKLRMIRPARLAERVAAACEFAREDLHDNTSRRR
jgi:hypothetical protein